MRSKIIQAILGNSGIAASVLLLASGASFADTVNLTAASANAYLPDGSAVPMWGYSCGTVVAGSAATCAKLNPNAPAATATTLAGWSPVVIRVPTGTSLTISLTNSLPGVPTSLTIVGQLGGGLGAGTTVPSPTHGPQGATWPVADNTVVNNPPPQERRVQSFATQVAPGAGASLTWTAPRAGTYLLESGTHPSIQGPMGLYGIVVVTTAPSGATPGTAYPAVGATPAITYNADIPLLLSEIDPIQNAAVARAVTLPGFSETTVWSGQAGGCGNAATPNSGNCYPPAVNYQPLYYLVNGIAFDKASNVPAAAIKPSLLPVTPATGVSGTGTVLVRLVNAGLRMHVPAIVGSLTGAPAVPGIGLIAEDGNPLPGVTRVQNEVFLAAGKTYDVKINVPAAGPALPIFDRALGLSGNATARDAGMLAYISVNGAGLPAATSKFVAAQAVADSYSSVISGKTVVVSDPAKGVIKNDINISGVKVVPGSVTGGTLTLNTNGTFTFAATAGSGGFRYCGNGAADVATVPGPCANVTLGAAPIEAAGGIGVNADAYTSTVATSLNIKSPGVLGNDTDGEGYPLTAELVGMSGVAVSLNADGSFNATVAPHVGTVAPTFTYRARNSQGTLSSATATATLTFPAASNLAVAVVDGIDHTTALTDYRWIIEEDRTFYVDPNCTRNPLPAGCPTVTPAGAPAVFGTNFHTSYMPVVAQGCVGPAGTAVSCEAGQTMLVGGAHVNAVCDIGNGICHPGLAKAAVLPSEVVLDPTKHYYISVLPGDGGHAMGGAQIAPGQTSVTVLALPEEPKPAKISVFVFEDDHPLNGEHDGTNFDQPVQNEPGLGGFNLTVFDLVGGTGDSAGQLTYDEFGQPLANALAGTIDPLTGADACPISKDSRLGVFTGDPPPPPNTNDGTISPTGLTGVIPVCPKYESDGVTISPLAGQAIIDNMPPGRYGVVATPGADLIARGEEWLQTNTLDGGKDHETFIKANEPAYFQEFGPAGYHVSIGFANPQFITDFGHALCTGPGAPACNSTVSGTVTGVHMSRTPDQRLYGTGTRDTFGYTQCYVSLGSPDGGDISFAKCDPSDGTFTLTNVPAGDWKVTVFDQWNDQIVDGISTPVRVNTAAGNTHCTGNATSGFTCTMGEVAVHSWKNNLSTRTFFDANNNGVSDPNEKGLALVPTNVRFRDGSISNLNSTDLEGFAGFNEVFPIFNWYVLETDFARYKTTGTHVVNDAGGPVDGITDPLNPYRCGQGGYPACGNSSLLTNLARTNEDFPLPAALRVPGARYCADADCPANDSAGGSTGRVDPYWVTSYGWQNFAGQNQYVEFGKAPFADGENGGIRGHVVYASTRPFDDPALLLQLTWEPQVPHVTINLYQVGTAPDGSQSLTKVDTTQTSSWDDWAQGFYPGTNKPYMNCPGQSPTDPFYYTLNNQPNYLDWYNSQHGGPAATALPNNSQYKCYDGMHNWNQLQPAPYDGAYKFPSVMGRDPTTGVSTGTNCSICTDVDSHGEPMLPAGKYVVEMVVPPGYELVKEEDKNILFGDAYEAPVTQQFAGFGNIFIMPDQAAVAATYNANNSLNMTTNLGAQPRHEGDTGSVETFWPCVGEARVVPDYNSLFPQSGQNAAFAGATRRLCDRKLVTLEDQMSVLAKFFVFSSTHVAGHFTGVITDDFTSEFDPFAPAFGEKFSPAYLPVSAKDWAGNEIARVYSDAHGIYNGLNYSSFSVNPPDPSGYIPTMMVMCMNDRGSGTAPDALYQSAYSQFCYELPFMPGQTGYFDTPVIPTASFAAEYNHPDCAYPDATPAISSVDGDGVGPWISASGTTHPITIHGLGDQDVNNYGYSGPSQTLAPWNQKSVTRHYGFCPSSTGSCTPGTVTIGGVTANVVSWNDSTIVVTLPSTGTQVPTCSVQQRGAGNGGARCGEVVITASNGKKSVDTVTMTIGGKAPTRLTAGQTIQSAIDHATPGDLIIVPPGNYHELVIMWKPVRLQGVGAASSVIDANAHPAGILNDWRLRIVCLFGLSPEGTPSDYDSGCGSELFNSAAGPVVGFNPTTNNPQVDRLPFEATVGWDATLNGNLAEQLQEPSLMGAYEGAGITVLGKGVRFPSDPFAPADGGFPDGTTLLTTVNNANCNNFASNFNCNPSRIDGLTIANSSQGGGGIFVHAWGHNLEIANNRVHNNQGTLAGGITIGQGEHADGYIQDAAVPNAPPGSCQTSNIAGTQLPYCFDRFVNVHHNAVTQNASEGDELFSATPSGAGGVAFCTGADNYQFNYNWVCGNLTTGDGAGVSQLGFIYNGSIQHNTILFNQATNPTTPSNGGGLLIMSAPDTDPTCPGEPDADCNHAFGTVGDGIGPGLTVNANLIMGNAAEAGAGGGVRFQGVNGTEVGTFPTNPSRWYRVGVTNNIITNNVAGWDGAGVSLQDSLLVDLINNTIASNDSTASSGTLFGSFFADQASAPTPCPRDAIGANIPCVPLSAPQPAGVSSATHSAEFLASLPGTITCPAGHGTNNTTGNQNNGACRTISKPILYNDVLWQNRAFNIVVTQPTSGAQQASVVLVPSLNQVATGDCITGATYWDLGLRGDTGPTNHSSGFTFTPQASVLTSIAGYPGGGATGFRANTASNPSLLKQYCNGAKIPPEAGATGWYQVPPGTNEGNVPVPVFNLTAGATVDEGNNWINISWGPLSLTHPQTGVVLGNYGLNTGSSAINYDSQALSLQTYNAAPANDFFENPRKANNAVDAGAVEFGIGPPAPAASVFPSPLDFGNWAVGTTSNVRNLTVTNTGNVALAGGTYTLAGAGFTRVTTGTFPAGAPNCNVAGTLALGASCTIKVQFTPGATGSFSGSVMVSYTGATVTPSPAILTGAGVATRAPVSVTPSPLTITVATPIGNAGTGTGTVTVTNNAAPGGSEVSITNVGVTSGPGSGVFTWFFSNGPLAGPDNCTGQAIGPGLSCTIAVRFTNVSSAVNVDRPGTINVTSTGLPSPVSGNLIGHANP